MTPYLEPKGAIWKQLLSQQEIPLYQQLAARIHIPDTWDQFWSLGEVDVMEKESHNPTLLSIVTRCVTGDPRPADGHPVREGAEVQLVQVQRHDARQASLCWRGIHEQQEVAFN